MGVKKVERKYDFWLSDKEEKYDFWSDFFFFFFFLPGSTKNKSPQIKDKIRKKKVLNVK